jgi:hypothetical protein
MVQTITINVQYHVRICPRAYLGDRLSSIASNYQNDAIGHICPVSRIPEAVIRAVMHHELLYGADWPSQNKVLELLDFPR